jgi:3-dehydrosphinganine reductase
MIIEIILGLILILVLLIYFIVKQNKRERMDFRGKHVVVTGGSSGIGLDLCLEAFKQGAHISIIARNKDKLNEIKTELENIKKQNDIYNSQMIQTESCDISINYEDTKLAIDRVLFLILVLRT